MGFFHNFVPVDLPTRRWVNSLMVTILWDFHTFLISLHNNPLNIPDISWTKGDGALCKHQGWIREDIFSLSTFSTLLRPSWSQISSWPYHPSCCLIFHTLLWPDTKSAEVRDQLLVPWVGFGLESWGRKSNSSWSHDSVVGICFPQIVR